MHLCRSCCFRHIFLLLTTARLIKRIVSGWWLLTSLKFISMASITGLSPVWDRIHASLNKLVTAAKQTCSVTQNIKHEGWVTFRIKKKDLYVCIFLKMYQHIRRHSVLLFLLLISASCLCLHAKLQDFRWAPCLTSCVWTGSVVQTLGCDVNKEDN